MAKKKPTSTPRNPYPSRVITWMDASCDPNWVRLPIRRADMSWLQPCVTQGFLVYEDDSMVCLAATVAPPARDGDDWTACGLMTIPKAWVRK